MLHVQEYHRSIFHTPNSSIKQQGYKTKLAFGDIAQFLHEEALIRRVEIPEKSIHGLLFANHHIVSGVTFLLRYSLAFSYQMTPKVLL